MLRLVGSWALGVDFFLICFRLRPGYRLGGEKQAGEEKRSRSTATPVSEGSSIVAIAKMSGGVWCVFCVPVCKNIIFNQPPRVLPLQVKRELKYG